MIGKLLAKTIRIATLPIDAVEIAADLATGGDGSRSGLRDSVPTLSKLRDKIADTAEEIDHD